MPLGTNDPDDEDSPRSAGSRSGTSRFGADRFGQPPGPWWRPSGTLGRVLLGVAVLAVLGGVTASAWVLKTYLGRVIRDFDRQVGSSPSLNTIFRPKLFLAGRVHAQ